MRSWAKEGGVRRLQGGGVWRIAALRSWAKEGGVRRLLCDRKGWQLSVWVQVGERYHSDGFQAKALLVIAACVRVSIATCCYVGCGCNTCLDRVNDIVCYNSAEHGSGACVHGLTPWFCPDCRLSTADLVVNEAKASH